MSRRAPSNAEHAWSDPTPMERALATLDMAMPAAEPPPGLWAAIERGLAAGAPISVAGLDIERYAAGAWRTLAPGVRIKRLWGKRTFLVECEAGAVVPPHRHRTAPLHRPPTPAASPLQQTHSAPTPSRPPSPCIPFTHQPIHATLSS